MHDLVIRGGTVVDGTGAAPREADVRIDGGTIAEVGRIAERGRDEIDARGKLVTPGFVDIHTHYDGQATWDPLVTPSCWHGVTTLVMGNCGVGFAPVRPGAQNFLIGTGCAGIFPSRGTRSSRVCFFGGSWCVRRPDVGGWRAERRPIDLAGIPSPR